MTLSRHLPLAVGRRLLRDAGPPPGWAIVALIIGSALITLATTQSGAGRLVLVLLGLAVLTAPSIIDADGWRIRLGMAWLAAEQRRRMAGFPRMPRTQAGAERWLEQPAAADTGLTQASVMTMTGQTREARELVRAYRAETAEDRARVERMLAAIDGMETGHVDPTKALTAIDALDADARRYHLLSLAWSTAWVEASHKRPWRRAFAAASAGVRPAGIPARYLGYAAFQQLLLAFVGLLLVVGLWVAGWL